MNDQNLDYIIAGFEEAIVFTETQDGEELSDMTRDNAKEFCQRFYESHTALVDAYAKLIARHTHYRESYEKIGHDLWLTNQGHGAGFWDRNIDKDMEDKLTSLCKFVSLNPWVEDGLIQVELYA
jgi:hypothetical protein